MTQVEAIFAHLKDLGIEWDDMTHPAARTMEDCRICEETLHAVMPRNLFLTPRNQSAWYLLLARPRVPFRTACVSRQIPASRLSFGDEEHLWELLRTRPGAISPMGLIFDGGRRVQLLVDQELRDCSRLAFHPNDNTRTLAMRGEDFFDAFLPSLNREPKFVSMEQEGSGTEKTKC